VKSAQTTGEVSRGGVRHAAGYISQSNLGDRPKVARTAAVPHFCDLLKATGRLSPRLTDSGEVQLVVDGGPFEASPDDPRLVAGELSWLSDLAVLAHEHLGDPLETRTLPTDELDRRLRAIRVRRCGGFALTISGLEIPVRGRERQTNGRFRRPPTFKFETRATAPGLEQSYMQLGQRTPPAPQHVGLRRSSRPGRESANDFSSWSMPRSPSRSHLGVPC
jgi:hypothetical protein